MSFTTVGQGAVLTRAAAAERLSGDPGGRITLLVDAESAGGVLNSHRSTFRQASDDAPPHYHTRSAELFVMLGGSLQVLLGERIVTLNAGDVLLVPRNVTHAFGAAPGAEADVLFVLTPGVPRFDYYRLLDRVHRGEASPQEIQDSQERFDNHYVDSPLWRQTRAAG